MPPAAGGSGTGAEIEATSSTGGTEETTVVADDGSSTGAAACPQSDLPLPFCHVLLPMVIPYRWAGHLDLLIDGVRPLVIHDVDAHRIRLVSPMDPGIVLRDGPASGLLPDDWWAGLTADFDGDGDDDFAAWNPKAGSSVTADLTIAVVDAESFEVVGLVPAAEGAVVRDVAALDANADGVVDLVTIEYLEDWTEVRAWRPVDGGAELIASAQGGVDYRALGAFTSDFDGDGRTDLAVLWDGNAAPHFGRDHDGINQIATVLAPDSNEEPLEIVHSPLAIWPQRAGLIQSEDGVAQLVVIETLDDIRILQWDGSGFSTVQTLAAPAEYERGSFGRITTGSLGLGSPGVLFRGLIENVSQNEAALFIGPPPPPFVTDTPITQQSWVADFNDDGVADFVATNGLYLSSIDP